MHHIRGIKSTRLATTIALLFISAPYALGGETTLVSQGVVGAQGDGESVWPSTSANGRFVAFESSASNMVPGDTNGVKDLFVHDLRTGTVNRVSLDSAGAQANDNSFDPSISADGRLVAFDSFASNLVPGDTNASPDVFLHDRKTGATIRVSVASDGAQGIGSSKAPSISANGRFVAFHSNASNLVLDDTNGENDIFVHDVRTRTTTRVSVNSAGAQGDSTSYLPSISRDGRLLAFSSSSSNLVPGDTNQEQDIFVHHVKTGTTTRVSVASDGAQADASSRFPSIAANGGVVVYGSSASNLVSGDTNGEFDIFAHDLRTGTTTRVSVNSAGEQADGSSFADPSISANGRFVALTSVASNLVPGDTNGESDIFVRDRKRGATTRVSVDSAGAPADGWSRLASISADGRHVAFGSFASNLVPGDTNNVLDVFVHDRN